MILGGVIEFLDWARGLGAELYSRGGGVWAGRPAGRPAGWPGSQPAVKLRPSVVNKITFATIRPNASKPSNSDRSRLELSPVEV